MNPTRLEALPLADASGSLHCGFAAETGNPHDLPNPAVTHGPFSRTLGHFREAVALLIPSMDTNHSAASDEADQSDRLRQWLCLWLAVCGPCLLISTHRLWLGSSEFPRVPFVVGLEVLGAMSDRWLCVAGLLAVAVLGGQAASGGRGTCRGEHVVGGRFPFRLGRSLALPTRAALLVLLASIALLVLRDQHRLQPWLCHFVILTLILARARRVALQRDLILITASLYVWSAWSKLDVSFITTYGQQLVEAMLGAVRLSSRFWSPTSRTLAAAMLPVGELVIAGLLLPRRTRRLGWVLSGVMHVALMLAVGPLGLNHLSGVLIWNVFFLGQNWLLFRTERSESPTLLARPRQWESWLALIVAVAPVLRSVGWLDHWPAWAVYASGIERVSLLVHESAIEKLEPSLRASVEPSQWHPGWRYLRIERWSLETVNAPIYPQDRFFVGVACAIAERSQLDWELKLVWQSAADRFTGKRRTIDYADRDAIEALAVTYRCNAKPVR